MEILLYKLKDIENIKDICHIAKKFGIKVSMILRENVNFDIFSLKDYGIEIYSSFDQYLSKNKDKRFLFFETYGNKTIFDIDLRKFDIYVFGAEDYGIPIEEISKVKNEEIVKIPMKIPGSFNVASTFVIFLSFYKKLL